MITKIFSKIFNFKKNALNLNTDKKNSFISTTDATPVTLLSYTFDQVTYPRIVVDIMCIDQTNKLMRSLKLTALVQRDSGSCRISGDPQITMLIGDVELQNISAEIVINGAAIDVGITGIDGMNLDWCAQSYLDILSAS